MAIFDPEPMCSIGHMLDQSECKEISWSIGGGQKKTLRTAWLMDLRAKDIRRMDKDKQASCGSPRSLSESCYAILPLAENSPHLQPLSLDLSLNSDSMSQLDLLSDSQTIRVRWALRGKQGREAWVALLEKFWNIPLLLAKKYIDFLQKRPTLWSSCKYPFDQRF